MIKESLTDRRNYGIDFLRIILMIMIPIHHILVHGGVLGSSIPLSLHKEVVWLLHITVYCAVNSFALISGYVGYGKQQRYSNLIYLYLQVIFYTIIMTVVFAIFKPEVVDIKTITKALFPFAYETYWYFTAYFCLFFFMPFLNLILDLFDRATIKRLLLCMFIVFSLLPTLFYYDFAHTLHGYSVLWLAIMYIVGAYLRKYKVSFFKENYKNLVIYFSLVVFTWLSKVIIEFITIKILNVAKCENYFVKYTSPTILFCSIFLFLFFVNMNCGKNLVRFISFFAPVSFGVYLFHEEPLFRENIIQGTFSCYLEFSPILMVLAIIGTAIAIWFVGSIVDKIRLRIFDLFRVRKFCVLVEDKLLSYWNRYGH